MEAEQISKLDEKKRFTDWKLNSIATILLLKRGLWLYVVGHDFLNRSWVYEYSGRCSLDTGLLRSAWYSSHTCPASGHHQRRLMSDEQGDWGRERERDSCGGKQLIETASIKIWMEIIFRLQISLNRFKNKLLGFHDLLHRTASFTWWGTCVSWIHKVKATKLFVANQVHYRL